MLAVLEQMRPGAMQLEIGVQSTYEKTGNEIHRKMDFERIRSVVKRINYRRKMHGPKMSKQSSKGFRFK